MAVSLGEIFYSNVVHVCGIAIRPTTMGRSISHLFGYSEAIHRVHLAPSYDFRNDGLLVYNL